MRPLAGVTRWTVLLAFFGGFASAADGWGILLVATSVFLQTCAAPHKPWRWATLGVASWAAGSVVVRLIPLSDAGPGSGLTVPVAFLTAYLAAALTWAAGRLAREG